MSTQPASAPQCCLCGNWLQFGSKALYGYQVCPKCHSDFAWKRAFAYILDMVFVNVILGVLIVVMLVIGIAIVGVGQGSANEDQAATAGGIIIVFGYLGCFLLAYVFMLLRDGFNGMSPGKRILGLQVINTVNGSPAKVPDSFKRNLILLVPVLPIVVAVQIFSANGVRIGDEWAQTKVIWKQYADRAPFLSLSGIQAQARARAAALKAAQPPVTNQPSA
jgi:uncharacterized RDD family membrane protein YckC